MGKLRLGIVAGCVAALVAAAASAPLQACVGKTIYLGRLPGKEQEILAELFTQLVGERTGTTVQIKPFADDRATHGAMEKAEIDLYLEDPGTAMQQILGTAPGQVGGDLRETVRREYEQRFNFVWLEPWGLAHGAGPAAPQVAPVVRKDTLKKFPALSRLVNKMAGVVDNASMARLVQESASRPARDVARQFLKEKKLI